MQPRTAGAREESCDAGVWHSAPVPRTDAETVGIAVVTGAGSGIGREASLALARQGWHVVLVGRTRERLAETASLCPRPEVVDLRAADVSDDRQVDALFDVVGGTYGRVDLLFNNAGVWPPQARLDSVTLSDWQSAIDINLTGAFLCARGAFRLMSQQQPRGGRIINCGSVAAHVPRPHSTPYAVAKHGLTGLTRAIALDGRPLDITCTQIDIGNARTELTDAIGAEALQPDGSWAAEATFDAAHVGRVVADIASLPLDVSVPTMTIMAARMPFAGRG